MVPSIFEKQFVKSLECGQTAGEAVSPYFNSCGWALSIISHHLIEQRQSLSILEN